MSSPFDTEIASTYIPPAELAFSSSISEFWKELNTLSPAQAYPAGVDLYQQGSPPQEVYLIESGLVKLSRLEEDGQELIVDLRFPGSLVGAHSVLIQKLYPVTAVTLMRCYLRRIPAGIFEHQVKTNTQMSWHVHQMHCHDAYSQVGRVSMLGCLTARHRLEELLWQLSRFESSSTHKEVRLHLPLKGHEIARWIAVTPAYLCRLFEQLESEAVLERRKGWLIIPDPQKLWHQSDC
jgi:CRP-like cAMP-binding protein